MTYTKEQWYKACNQVEASGRTTGEIIGDGGKARGPLQIHVSYWKDSNIGGKYEDVDDWETAKKCADGYLKRYGKSSWSDTMSLEDCEKCAKIHNGGPGGPGNPATNGYWEKFKKHL